jgi:hypothetical protein
VSRPPLPSSTDAALQQLHAQAVARLSPATLARLHGARHAAPQRTRAHGWWLATACSAVAALGLGYSFTVSPPRPAALPVTATLDDGIDVLDENPDLYVWLAGTDLAME